MKVLAIETSCDETAVTVLNENQGIFTTEYHVVLSQADMHAQYGGVFPNMAKREHTKNLPIIIGQYLDSLPAGKKSEIESLSQEDQLLFDSWLERFEKDHVREHVFSKGKPIDIDAIVVTRGPGLEPTLWVGVNLARALALSWGLPLIPSNHMAGHVVSVFTDQNESFSLPEIQFPALSLLISGGHTEIVSMKSWTEYEKLGKTRDDAVGEAFDKVARLLGLPYPGGRLVSELADIVKTPNPDIKLPRPMLKTDDYEFSFSGLKTAVLRLVQEMESENILEEMKPYIAYEFEQAVIDVLTHKTVKAVQDENATTLIVAGGVSANPKIKKSLENALPGVNILFPRKGLTGDNSLMIALDGILRYQSDKNLRVTNARELDKIRAYGNWSIDEKE